MNMKPVVQRWVQKKRPKSFYVWFKDQNFTPWFTPSFFFCMCSIFLSRLWNMIINQCAAKSSSQLCRGVSISGLMTNDLRQPLYANDERLNKSPCVRMSTLPHRLPSAFPTAAFLLYSHCSGSVSRTAHLLLDIVFQFFVAAASVKVTVQWLVRRLYCQKRLSGFPARSWIPN